MHDEDFTDDLLNELDNTRQIPYLRIPDYFSSQNCNTITGTTAGLLDLNSAIVQAIGNDGGYAGVLLPSDRPMTIYVEKNNVFSDWQNYASPNLIPPNFSNSSRSKHRAIPISSITLRKLQTVQQVFGFSSLDDAISWLLCSTLPEYKYQKN